MNEEEIKEIIDKIKQEEFPYALAIAKAYEKLQQENKHLKEKLDIADTNYDIIYDYFSKVNELLGTELCEEVLSEILKLKSENEELKKYCCKRNDCGGRIKENNKPTDSEVLTEFEKWLEEAKECIKFPVLHAENIYARNVGYYFALKDCKDKIQELKEVKIMNLWIRSQDKERLTEVNDLRIYYGKEEDLWAIEDCDDLGYYKTKERALEVLDEIQMVLFPKRYLNELEDLYTNLEIKNKYNNTYVYEMPKE